MIGIIGINHKTAPIHIRELFSIDKDKITELGSFLQGFTAIDELVVLSTCNRTEVYYYQGQAGSDDTSERLIVLLKEFLEINTDYSSNFYIYHNTQAIKHLFSVVSGIDSMIFGEDQIVNQVKEAYLHCTNNNMTDAVLMRLFQKAFETGKKVRTETNVQQGATSISYLAVEMCQQYVKKISDKNVLIVGVGDTGRLVLQKMKKIGVTNFSFTNRTYSKSLQLAKENNGKALRFEDFISKLNEFDIVITATNAGEVLISTDDVRNACSQRDSKQQIYIDLAVPRNIHHGVKANKNARLIAVDDLQEVIDKNATKRLESSTDAKTIINEMASEYKNWYQNRNLRPIIQAITENMQKLHEAEITGYSNNYNNETYCAVNEYASRLTQKYIRTLIKNLREINENGQPLGSLDTIKELFIFGADEEK